MSEPVVFASWDRGGGGGVRDKGRSLLEGRQAPMASLLRGGEETMRHKLLGFALGAIVAGGVALDIKMKIWKKTTQAAENRLCPPQGPETMNQVDGVLDTRQRQFLAREWNKVKRKGNHIHMHTDIERLCHVYAAYCESFVAPENVSYIIPMLTRKDALSLSLSVCVCVCVCVCECHIICGTFSPGPY